jgi:hypothetical protein
MLLEEPINKLVRDVVNLVLETPGYTIKTKQEGAPRPQGAYAVVDFLASESLGWEQRIFKDNVDNLDVTEYISGLRNITMSINFYRANAMDNSRKVRIGLVRESIQSLFSSAGVGLVSRSEVRDIDGPTDDGWEERSQFDLVLNTVATDQDIVKSIQAIDIASEFQYRGLKYNFNTEV